MSAYWFVVSGVPEQARSGDNLVDKKYADEGCEGIVVTQLGMFDGKRWSRDLSEKISMFNQYLVELFGEEYCYFFPGYEGDFNRMEGLLPLIPSLLERLPGVIEKVERGDERHKLTILQFLRALGPTFRQVLAETQDGKGWVILAK